ncbi:hypothetical protein EVAR_7959_1 [Eumeta japonica]|uniref:Uncharacterized protein n=1 Tax=Eumeta variegata TaxID=151549 RepID=A0A4C1TGV8_EUMVA|nr:hypothetical protein EVAR_7959_1 [Eumeta japonica]
MSARDTDKLALAGRVDYTRVCDYPLLSAHKHGDDPWRFGCSWGVSRFDKYEIQITAMVADAVMGHAYPNIRRRSSEVLN